MSKAFTRESDTEDVIGLPERDVSLLPNPVTSRGLILIEAEIAGTSAANAEALAADDKEGAARAGRDMRYGTARRNSAQLQSDPSGPESVLFGSAVNILRADGRRQSFRTVGGGRS